MQRLRLLIPQKGTPQRLVLLGVAATSLLIVAPFFFWFFTWYGWALDPVQVESALSEPLRPGQAAQMLMLIGEKFSRGDHGVRRYNPSVLRLSMNQNDEIRRLTAWLMGKDPQSNEFQPALSRLLGDSIPMVRRAAAVSLANFHDQSARPELEAMLAPFRPTTPIPGHVQLRVQSGDTTTPTTVVARVSDVDVIAWVPGAVDHPLVQDGAELQKGQELLEIRPDDGQMMEAKRALRLLEANRPQAAAAPHK